MIKFRYLIGALCIYQCVSFCSTLSLVGSKQYRIDRYIFYNCDKSTENEYLISNRGTMKIFGGKDKLNYEGFFEVLKDINEEIKLVGFLSRCSEKDPEECEFKRREVALPTICSRSEKPDDFQITTVMHKYMRKMVLDVLEVLEPPIVCPVIKKNKYYLNVSLDLSPANFLPLEGSRWTFTTQFSMGGANPVQLICMDLEMTVRRGSRRLQTIQSKKKNKSLI